MKKIGAFLASLMFTTIAFCLTVDDQDFNLSAVVKDKISAEEASNCVGAD